MNFSSVLSTWDVTRNVSASPTPAATINLDASTANVFKWTAGENETVNVTAGQLAGRVMTLMIANDALARTITFGTGFVSLGVIVGTALKTSVSVFQSDGTSFYELSRTLGL